jgi:hypothetical protein
MALMCQSTVSVLLMSAEVSVCRIIIYQHHLSLILARTDSDPFFILIIRGKTYFDEQIKQEVQNISIILAVQKEKLIHIQM